MNFIKIKLNKLILVKKIMLNNELGIKNYRKGINQLVDYTRNK